VAVTSSVSSSPDFGPSFLVFSLVALLDEPGFARHALIKTPAPANEILVINCLLFESKLNLLADQR
jgi:hypothetical protein